MDDSPGRTSPEASLLALAKAGNMEAFEQIVALHERRVFGLALRLTASVEDANDATQETFIRLHRKLRQIDSNLGVGSWLYAVITPNAADSVESHIKAGLGQNPPPALGECRSVPGSDYEGSGKIGPVSRGGLL